MSELYIENENYEYMSFHYNEYVLLRDKFSIIKNMDNILYGDEKKLTNYPLEDTWKDFYKKGNKRFSYSFTTLSIINDGSGRKS